MHDHKKRNVPEPGTDAGEPVPRIPHTDVDFALERVTLIEQFELRAGEMEKAWAKEKETLARENEKLRREAETLSAALEEARARTDTGAQEREKAWEWKLQALKQELAQCQEEFDKKYQGLLSELAARAAALEKNSAQKEARLLQLHENMVNEFQAREAALLQREAAVNARAATLNLRTPGGENGKKGF